MNVSNIFINDLENLDKNKQSLKKYINVVILNEEIYTKKYSIKEYKSLKEVEASFGDNSDFLFHHFYINKGKEIITYAIKGESKVKNICKNAKQVTVKPIQIYVLNVLMKIIKEDKFNVIFLFKNRYYFICCNSGIINYSLVEENINNLIYKVINKIDEKILIDSRIEFKNNILEGKYKELELGDIFEEKRIFKQKLFT